MAVLRLYPRVACRTGVQKTNEKTYHRLTFVLFHPVFKLYSSIYVAEVVVVVVVTNPFPLILHLIIKIQNNSS